MFSADRFGDVQKESSAMNKLLHVALISFRENTSEDTKRTIQAMYATLAEDCGGIEAGILSFKIGPNQDLRRKVGYVWDLVEVAVFRDDEALQAFRNHPKHKAITDVLSTCADWVVGDLKD